MPDLPSSSQAASQKNRPTLSPEWAAQLEAVMQGDRDFFVQHPERDYYVRPITPVEVMEGRAMGRQVDETAEMLVGEVVPGSRVRLTIVSDLDSTIAEFRTIQQQLRREVGGQPATLKDRIKQGQKVRPKAKGFG